jgi:hypothetical protein
MGGRQRKAHEGEEVVDDKIRRLLQDFVDTHKVEYPTTLLIGKRSGKSYTSVNIVSKFDGLQWNTNLKHMSVFDNRKCQ